MFGITYENWKYTCDMYFSLPEGVKKVYLQWFPFCKLSEEDRNEIAGFSFFNKYIKTGGFVFFPSVMSCTDNYIQKSDGSFRDSSLVSPLLYLVIQSLGKTIYDYYIPKRTMEIDAYYAGSFQHSRARYTKDYDDFYKAVNAWSENHSYFIKTDITSFYGNIKVDRLVDQIDSVCNAKVINFSQTQLMLFKELLLYCGNGRFPLVENSVALSFLATIIYLDTIDCRLHSFISDKITDIESFKMIRYVDDLYILFSSEKKLDELSKTYNAIRNEYSSILKENGLALNAQKCCIKETVDLDEELKKSLYEDFVHGEDNNIPELFSEELKSFMKGVETAVIRSELTHEKYEELIQTHFKRNNIVYTAHEVFNHLVFDNSYVWSDELSGILTRIIKEDVTSLSIDPKVMAIMVMKSGQDKAIKSMLSSLFERFRTGMWNSYDTTIAISYLIQSQFSHLELINTIKVTDPQLFEYYIRACKTSFLNQTTARKWNRYIEFIGADTKASFLYFMYKAEYMKGNYLSAYAFYKNFFDRVSADMAFKAGIGKDKKPNYTKYYQDKDLISLYCSISDSKQIIKKAHKLRNKNPLDHASAELLDNDSTREELYRNIIDLDELINQFSIAHANCLD